MRKQMLRWMSFVSVALAAMAFFAPQRAAADEDDPPSRVARLAYTRGNVSFNPAGTDDWVTAVVNRPMTTGDKLWSDEGSRAELHLGSAVIRLSDHTGFSFLNLADDVTQVRLTEGTLNIRVRRLDDDDTFEVDTPNLAFSILRAGRYRVSVNEAGDSTIVAVRDGQGEITGGGSAYAIHSREEGYFKGLDYLEADIQHFRDDEDNFDRWCSDRDRRWDHSVSSRYVSDDVVGYEDLDEHGGWRSVPEYGNVWFPRAVVVGWAPYRYGHWVWISPWGWTWVDDEPWGFAPFHYGRWVVVGGVWGWVPCPPRPRVVTVAYVRPVYAPALVAWVGGAHWGVGVSVGGPPAVGVAWFPLGPRDVYCPSYRVSQRYVERVNVSNTVIVNRTQVTNVYNNVYVNKTVNVTNITYQNQHINNAVTATSNATFTSAQSVHNNMIRVNEREVTAAPVAPTGPAVVPQQRSVLGAGAEARVRPNVAFSSRAVVAKTAPPPAPVPFTRQQQAIQANGGRPIAISQERELQPQNNRPNVHIAPPARQMPPQNDRRNAMENRSNQPNQVNPGNQNPVNQQNQVNQNRPPEQQGNPNRPATITNDNIQNNRGNDRGNRGNQNRYNDRPPAARQEVNPQLEQKHQQELDNLRQQQDRERQKVEQQQVQQQQKFEQRNANPGNQRNDRPGNPQNDNPRNQPTDNPRNQRSDNPPPPPPNNRNQQQMQERQQRQLEQLEQKHEQQQQKLEQRQDREVQKSRSENKPQKESKNNDKPKNNDK